MFTFRTYPVYFCQSLYALQCGWSAIADLLVFIYVILLQIVVIYVYVIPVRPLSRIFFYKFCWVRIISG